MRTKRRRKANEEQESEEGNREQEPEEDEEQEPEEEDKQQEPEEEDKEQERKEQEERAHLFELIEDGRFDVVAFVHLLGRREGRLAHPDLRQQLVQSTLSFTARQKKTHGQTRNHEEVSSHTK